MSDKKKNDKINAELDSIIDELLEGDKKKEKGSEKKERKISLVSKDEEDDVPEETPEDEIEEVEEERSGSDRRRKLGRRNSDIELAEGYELGLPPVYRFFIRLFIFLVIVGGILAFIQFKCKIKNVEIVGNTWYSDDQIMDCLQNKFFDEYAFGFKAHYMVADTPEMAFVNSFKIKLTGLDSVKITVYEKSIVGCVQVQSDYMFFDKDGAVVASLSVNDNHIPMVTGLNYTQATVGKKLEVENDSVFKTILEITQLVDKYEIGVDSIDFDDSFNVTLYCTDGNQVYLGNQTGYDEVFMQIPDMLSQAESKGCLYWIDLSTYTGDESYFLGKIIENN